MLTVKRQLPPVAAPARLLALPALDGVCQPVQLGRYMRDLGHYGNEQLERAAHYQRQGETALAALAGQHFVFTCYQLLSMMAAWQCWGLFQQECAEQRHIIIDNLTGVLAPGPARQEQAAILASQLFKTDVSRQTAWRVYQLASAFLHSYPHLGTQGAELRTAYRDADGHWLCLGPWPLEELTEAMTELLLNWQ